MCNDLGLQTLYDHHFLTLQQQMQPTEGTCMKLFDRLHKELLQGKILES